LSTIVCLFMTSPALGFAPDQSQSTVDELLPLSPEAINRALNEGAPDLSSEQIPVADSKLQDLTETIGGRWSVHSWNPVTLTPRLISGSGFDLPGAVLSAEEAEAAARSFVDNTTSIWGLSSSQLEIEDTKHGLGKWAVHFYQTRDGVRVLGSRLNVLMVESGRISAFGGDLWPLLQAPTTPLLTEDEAFARAREALVSRGFAPFAEQPGDWMKLEILGILPASEESGLLVYRVRAKIQDPLGSWMLDVDARTGEVHQIQDYLRRVNLTGWVSGKVQTPSWCEGESDLRIPFIEVTIDGVGTDTTDVNGVFLVPHSGTDPESIRVEMRGPYVFTNNVDGPQALFKDEIIPGIPFVVHWNDLNARHDERDVFFHTNGAHEMLKSADSSWTDMDYPLPANVNIDLECNAFWDGESINFYRAGGGCANTGEIGDVVAHEYGHGITDFMYGPNDPPRDMHEGNSDVTGNYFVDSPIVGRGLYLDDCVDGIRNSDNNLQWPEDTGGGPHHDGQIIAGFHWDIWSTLGAILGDAGKQIALELWHYGRLMGLPQSQPEQVMYTFLVDDDDGNMDNGTPHFDALCFGALHHGFDCPEIFDAVVIHHDSFPYIAAPDSQTVDITADIYSLMGEINPDSVFVFYREVPDSSGEGAPIAEEDFESVLMTATGEGIEYLGEIPHFPVLTVLEYYMLAIDELGNQLTDPRDAPIGLHSVSVATVYDPFEEDTGWTVGDVEDDATQGIWERVDPEGTRLAGWQLQPEDDATPDPGTHCWITGQHEGGQPWDSDADGQTTLLSPVYDLSEYTWASLNYNLWFQTFDEELGIMIVDISNDGGETWAHIDFRQGFDDTPEWSQVRILVHQIFPVLDQFRLRVIMLGQPNPSIDEGGFDDFVLTASVGLPSDVQEAANRVPLRLNLASSNPVAGPTRLRYGLPETGRVKLRVVDVSGRVVSTLIDGVRPAGLHEVSWNGRDASGRSISSGIYFIQLLAPKGRVTERVVLLK
jgi:hypothetical protein